MTYQKHIETALLGTIALLLGWTVGTLLHEGCHLLAAGAFNIPATLGQCTISTGSVILCGSLTAPQTAIIAMAGSVGLVIAGVVMVRLSSNPAIRMVGVVFLCRAWVDVLPIGGMDGAFIAGSAGYFVAGCIVIIEITICGAVILRTVADHQ